MSIESLRVRACLACKRYIVLHPDNPVSQRIEKLFIGIHSGSGHMVSVITLDNITSEYICNKTSDFKL